jgi:hypothetical protein
MRYCTFLEVVCSDMANVVSEFARREVFSEISQGSRTEEESA